MQWDIFCRVIDNFGDIGVCWRLARDLAQRGHTVRLWADDLSALAWLAPDHPTSDPGVKALPWLVSTTWPTPGDVVIEAFGCDLPEAYVRGLAQRHNAGHPSIWINLEYLSAEPYAERNHRLPSPVMTGAGAGLTKHFFYPGFTPGTGGLLREADLARRQAAFDRHAWLAQLLGESRARLAVPGLWVCLFCYEPAGLPLLLDQLSHSPVPVHLLVSAGRATAAVKNLIEKNSLIRSSVNHSLLSITYLQTLSQIDFDHLLWACDLNCVRGEDSLVRALWAGKPLLWHIYPQDDDAHHAKLQAFLDCMGASPALRHWHALWNNLPGASLPSLSALWRDTSVAEARKTLLSQHDLASQLIAFAAFADKPTLRRQNSLLIVGDTP